MKAIFGRNSLSRCGAICRLTNGCSISRRRTISTFDEKEIQDIKNEFKDYTGGTVTLNCDQNTGIATICIDNQTKRNALSGHMMVELADCMDKLEEWDKGKGVFLYSKGPVFCSGGDLKFIATIANQKEKGHRMTTFMHHTFTRLQRLPLVSVALVKGPAVGGGAEMPTACDFRLLTPDASFKFGQIQMGLVTGWGGGTRLVQLVGPQTATLLTLSGVKVDAEQALGLGLATHVISTSEEEPAIGEAIRWLVDITKGETVLVRAMKKIVANAREKPMGESLQEERKIFASVWGEKQLLRILNEKLDKGIKSDVK